MVSGTVCAEWLECMGSYQKMCAKSPNFSKLLKLSEIFGMYQYQIFSSTAGLKF
jgi:hypothetical protein